MTAQLEVRLGQKPKPALGIAGGAPELENAEQRDKREETASPPNAGLRVFAISDTAAMMMPHKARLTT
ncbi:MAG: hypothetical protein ABWY82_07550, partial [Tardiphaga sp.]